MIERVISGGQTGADQAGWRAAKRFGIATGGWMPRDFLTESGSRPEFARLYGAREMPTCQYPPRTRKNAAESNATIWFGRGDSRGFNCTYGACTNPHRPFLTVLDPTERPPSKTVIWIQGFRPRVINIAGNRESSAPGIGAWVEEYLCDVFRAMGLRELQPAPPTPDPH